VATVVFYTIVIVVIVTGGLSAVFPERTVAIRRRLGFSENWLSGGWCYATATRARVTGAMLVFLGSIALILHAISGQ
jgi:hypothetical protein